MIASVKFPIAPAKNATSSGYKAGSDVLSVNTCIACPYVARNVLVAHASPRPSGAAQKRGLQSLAARLIRGDAGKSVTHVPSTPPAKLETEIDNPALVVDAASVS